MSLQSIKIAFLILAAAATPARAQDDAYARTQGGQLDSYQLLVSNFEIGHPESPKILVRFDNPFSGTTVGGLTFALEWTANGEPQSANFEQGGAKCLTRTYELWCTAFTNWFKGPPVFSANRTHVRVEEFPQAFYLIYLEYGKRYCFRLQATTGRVGINGLTVETAPWSRWTCVRTPPAPAPILPPPAPLQPNVTMMPATDGIGVPGGALPIRALIEWQVPGDTGSVSIRSFVVERSFLSSISAPKWDWGKTIFRKDDVGETTVTFEPGAQPSETQRFLFRVCTENDAGRACSPARATTPFTPGPLAEKGRRPLPPFPGGPVDAATSVTAEAPPAAARPRTYCELARQARARNSPAAPGLEATCAAKGPAATPPATNKEPQSPPPVSVRAVPRIPVSTPPLPICEAARNARARNSPAAPGLEAKCAAESGAATGTSDGPAAAVSQADNTISVRVTYPKEYGYKGDTNAFGKIGPTSCRAFSLEAVVVDAAARQRNPISVSSDSRMMESGESYVCNYLISQVPLDQMIGVRVRVLDADLSGRWEDCRTTCPPAGQVRAIADATRTATLTSSQPRASIVYQMVYAAAPGR